MKGKLACGGTVKGNSIELQGNHRERVKELLTVKGYSVDNIS
jgi:translation initiation factor 1